jgi:Na+/proline symporter
MRFLNGLFLIAFLAVVGYLAYDNRGETHLRAFTLWEGSIPLPLLIGAVYVLGMVSGWAVVGMMKRSWQRVTEADRA